ncbi:thioester reductase domain-containing protein [Candidatus Halobeggiatoa sp. HSG11]|nr:thioester reductase domain-containing protein [Candidatus Halobeggiatoa sp. HSG11]
MAKLDLQAEAVLDHSIQFNNPLSNSINPKSIFLTGATGFLGVCLLSELIHTTDAHIYCLIRCKDLTTGKHRLKKILQEYSLWQPNFESRITIVSGNLAKPFLGLSKQQFNNLATKIDIIYHIGTQVNSVYPYSALKAINVLGTQEVIRLASIAKTKPIHFTSTVAVFFSQTYSKSKLVLETDDPCLDVNLKGGYKQSKWVAEHLIKQAQERGLPACIYRITRIMGHSETGINNNYKDFLCNMMKGCIQLSKFPTVGIMVNIVPVDYVSKAIRHLSLQENSFGKCFHISNPNSIYIHDLFINICSLGYFLEELSYDEWLAILKEQVFQHPKKYAILSSLLRSPTNLLSNNPKFDSSNTFSGLLDTKITCPPIDKQLLAIYFSYFQQVGYMPSPESLKLANTS